MRLDIQQNVRRVRAYLEDVTRRRQRPTFSDVSLGLLDQCREFVAAVQFLSVIPVPGSERLFRTSTTAPQYITGSGYFPLVGLLIGVCTCILPQAFGQVLPPLALAALITVALVVLTGGLHFDGLMDSCDGLLVRADRDRQLEIMRDSRVGSFGVLGGACVLLLKFSLLASLSLPLLFPALLIGPTVARWAMILAVRIFPLARATGLGVNFRGTVTVLRLALAGFVALLVAVGFGQLVGLLIWLGATLMAIVIGGWATQKLGGLTGDVYGAIAEICEVTALLVLVLFRFWL